VTTALPQSAADRIDAGLLHGSRDRHALAVVLDADLRRLQVFCCKLIGQIALDLLGGTARGLNLADQRDGPVLSNLNNARKLWNLENREFQDVEWPDLLIGISGCQLVSTPAGQLGVTARQSGDCGRGCERELTIQGGAAAGEKNRCTKQTVKRAALFSARSAAPSHAPELAAARRGTSSTAHSYHAILRAPLIQVTRLRVGPEQSVLYSPLPFRFHPLYAATKAASRIPGDAFCAHDFCLHCRDCDAARPSPPR
jgi:hypothetical protein